MQECSMTINTDGDWVRRSFMVPSNRYENTDDFMKASRNTVSAKYKFTDTSLGGNFAINPPPQFCRNADLVEEGLFSGSNGQGRYYSESLDDHGQYVHMRFGVPQFNSLTSFFGNFYSYESGLLANRGRSTGLLYSVAKATGYVVALPLKPIVWLGQAIRFLGKMPASKYYYMKPAMPLYWNAVNTMANMIGVNMGLIGDSIGEKNTGWIYGENNELDETGAVHKQLYQKMNSGSGFNSTQFQTDVWRSDGGIDIFKVATRAQRMAHKQRVAFFKAMEKINENDTTVGALDDPMKVLSSQISPPKQTNFKDLPDYVQKYHQSTPTKYDGGGAVKKDNEGKNVKNEKDQNVSTSDVAKDNLGSYTKDGFWEHLKAELEDGAAFITLRVDNPGTTSESFSNSVGESGIASKLNGMSSSARQTNFNFQGGESGIDLIDVAVNAVKDTVGGLLDGVGLSGLLTLAGSAFADIPKVWENSSVSLPTSSYTMELRSPYGNPVSRYQNLIVPLSMILAACLPLSTGKHSYTSPFLVELYSKGRNQIRMGMIDSLSITRGTGNLGWNKNNEPLGIDVSFSVVDLSSILHMPITSNFEMSDAVIQGLAGAVGIGDLVNTLASSNFDDDNSFNDYMSVLGSVSLADQFYVMNKIKLKKTQRAAEFQKWKSSAHYANWVGGTMVGRLASAVTHISDRG